LNCLNDKDGLIYIFSTLIAATLALAANGKAGVAHTLRPLEAGTRIAGPLTGAVSLTEININIPMTARRRAIQQE
jgi:hypothetical protein